MCIILHRLVGIELEKVELEGEQGETGVRED